MHSMLNGRHISDIPTLLPSLLALLQSPDDNNRDGSLCAPHSTAFFCYLNPMIAPFMLCNRFSACFSRDLLRMYCLSLIVSDYPAKLSHPALQQQQVPAAHMPPHGMSCFLHQFIPCVTFHPLPRSCTCCRLWPSTLPPLYPTCVLTPATFLKSSSYVFLVVSSP